jgi:hypothetical protein
MYWNGCRCVTLPRCVSQGCEIVAHQGGIPLAPQEGQCSGDQAGTMLESEGL